jgi:hypothetical protein
MDKEGEYPKRVPTGVYDQNILCEECEPIFGDWDNYALRFLMEGPPWKALYAQNQRVGYEIWEYDYKNLKLFFLSLLWRASVSQHPFYRRVNLGPREDVAKALIKKANPGTEHEFSVTLAKFDHPLGSAILDPHPEKWDDVNYYRFYLSSYVAYVKVDKRKAPNPHRDFILRKNPPLYVICRDLARSKELPLMKKIATAANKRLQSTQKPRG